MHAWWPLAAGAALFALLAVLFLRRSARSRPGVPPSGGAVAGRRLTSPVDDSARRARHRLDVTHPFARYPVARQRPVPHPPGEGPGTEPIQRF